MQEDECLREGASTDWSVHAPPLPLLPDAAQHPSHLSSTWCASCQDTSETFQAYAALHDAPQTPRRRCRATNTFSWGGWVTSLVGEAGRASLPISMKVHVIATDIAGWAGIFLIPQLPLV